MSTRYECSDCCYAVNGSAPSYPDDKFTEDTRLDAHEADNPGHRMFEVPE